MDMTSNGIAYTWEYGAVRHTEEVAVLYRRSEHTDQDIEDAKQEITEVSGCKRFRVVDLSDVRAD